MKNIGAMNKLYRVVWNASKGVWQAVAEFSAGRGKAKSGKGARRRLRLALLSCSVAGSSAFAANLPTDGNVVAGNGNISQSGNTMTINQSSSKMVIDWQSFSIGQGYRVNFVQPSASSVALNRVLGSDVSQIQGSLTANGQVFLINPNGVLFTPTAQVNVGGLVASTLSMSNTDFMAGNYRFEGASSNAIVNQGNITAADGGSIALIAARITNEGTLTANAGNVLLGAGSKVVLDLGGPVKLQVEQGAIDALIQNGGAIKADGGLVYLTAKAAGELASTVINNTGLIEAQTLATGEKGQIYLQGGMEHDRIVVGGKLDASAPNGGDGGFIETSAAKVQLQEDLRVTTLAASGQTGNWLIDPATYTVAASGGDETGAALAGRLGGTNITLQADSAVNINDAVSWSANKLTLSSGADININASLSATGTASLAFVYGQASANGSGSAYTVGNGAKIYIPDATAFTWKKGSGGTVNNLVFNNGNLHFGDGTEAALTSDGQLKQPFYKNNAASASNGQCATGAWCQLTYSDYPLDIAVGNGGTGTNSWNYNGQVLSTGDNNYSPALSNKSLEISGYREGTGTIVSSGTLTFDSGAQVKVENAYTLASGTQYVKTDTTLTNLGGSVSNLRLWVGTRDDYVAGEDQNYKLKGNLGANGFESITAQSQQAKAIEVANSTNGTGTAILFYSTSSGADTVSDTCCDFSNVTNKDPRSSQITTSKQDGSYALFSRLADLTPGQSGSMTWYYAAAPASQIASVATSVAESAGVATPAPAPAPTPAPAPASVPAPLVPAIANAQTHFNNDPPAARPNQPYANPAQVRVPSLAPVNSPEGNLVSINTSGGLNFVALPQQEVASSRGSEASGNGSSQGSAGGMPTVLSQASGVDTSGFMKVFVVGGGVRLPSAAQGNPSDESRGGNR